MLIKLSCKGDQFWFFIDIKEQIKYEVSFFYLPLHSLRKEGISWASRWPRNWRALQLYLKVQAWWGFYPITFMAYVVYASREGNGTPLQYSCLENPMEEEPGRLQAMGSLRVRHDWATLLSLFTFLHWRRKWQPTPVFLPGESQGQGSLVSWHLWGHTESDTTEAMQSQTVSETFDS